METIKIAHLYYDLMNLYGETGNITALKKHFLDQGLKVDVELLTKGDKIDFKKYDVFYMGMGTENNQNIVRKDILKYKKDIKAAIKNKTFIITGNSLDLFGKSINDEEALNAFDFKTSSLKVRCVGEKHLDCNLIDSKIIGFVNTNSGNNISKDNLFENEGIHKNNFYGTMLLGPLLIRNPKLTDYIVKNILDEKKIQYKEITNTPDYKAYEEFIKNFNIK